MKTRVATKSDAAAIASLYVRTRRVAYEAFFPAEYLAEMSVELYTAAWQERFSGNEPTMRTILAEDSRGNIAGFTRFGHLGGLPDHEGEVEFMYVGPEHWRKGAGAMLMSEAVRIMTRDGLESAVLWVYRDNERARRFYEACGWRHDGAEQDRKFAGALIRQLRYRRALKMD